MFQSHLCTHLDVLVLGQEEEQPGGSGGRGVLPGQQQTNQHARYFIVRQAAATPETIRQTDSYLYILTFCLPGSFNFIFVPNFSDHQ